MSPVVLIATLLIVPLVLIVMVKSAIMAGKWLWDNAVGIMLVLIFALVVMSIMAHHGISLEDTDRLKQEYTNVHD